MPRKTHHKRDGHPPQLIALCITAGQCAFSAQLPLMLHLLLLPLMLHLLLLPLQTKHLSLAVRQHRCQRQLTFLDPSPVGEYLPILIGKGLCHRRPLDGARGGICPPPPPPPPPPPAYPSLLIFMITQIL